MLTFVGALPQFHEDSLSRVVREAHPILTYCLPKELTDTPLKRNPFREAESPLAGQEITCVSCSPNYITMLPSDCHWITSQVS